MRMFLISLWKSLIGYFSQWPNLEFALYLVVGAIAVSYILRSIYFHYVSKNNNKNIYYSYQVSGFFSNLTTLFLIVVFTIVFTKFYSFIYIHGLQSVIIIILLVYLILLTRNYFLFLQKNLKFELCDFGVYAGPIAKNEAQSKNKSRFKRHRLAGLVLLIPFLILLINSKQKVLFSIVFDNSVSMEEQNTNACNSLSSIISNLPEGVDFSITTIKPCNSESEEEDFIGQVKKNMNEIVDIKNSGQLYAITESFNNNLDLREYINNGISTNRFGGSPIYECIWDNFIVSSNLNSEANYSRKNLIVLTDGEDILYHKQIVPVAPNQCIFSFPLKDNITISDFYDNITFINYSSAENYLYSNLCGEYSIVQGSDSYEIKKAIETEFSDVYIDWNFIWLILIFVIVFSFIIILKV